MYIKSPWLRSTLFISAHKFSQVFPASHVPSWGYTGQWRNADLMLAHRLRRWANIKPAFRHCPTFAGSAKLTNTSIHNLAVFQPFPPDADNDCCQDDGCLLIRVCASGTFGFRIRTRSNPPIYPPSPLTVSIQSSEQREQSPTSWQSLPEENTLRPT